MVFGQNVEVTVQNGKKGKRLVLKHSAAFWNCHVLCIVAHEYFPA